MTSHTLPIYCHDAAVIILCSMKSTVS